MGKRKRPKIVQVEKTFKKNKKVRRGGGKKLGWQNPDDLAFDDILEEENQIIKKVEEAFGLEEPSDTEQTLKKSKVKWFPIYADKKNHVQIDLTFLPTEMYLENRDDELLRPNQAYLTVIFLNTRFAFARPVLISVELPIIDKNKENVKTKPKFTKATAERVWDAFKLILDKDIPAANEKLKKARTSKDKDGNYKLRLSRNRTYNLKIDQITCDMGGEFKKPFSTNCEARGIKIHRNDPNIVNKRQLGLVERFNRTFKKYMSIEATKLGYLNETTEQFPTPKEWKW